MGFFKVTNAIFDKDIGLTEHDKVVFMYLCRVTNGKLSGWSSYTTIGDKCGISRRTAIRSVKHLLSYELIEAKRIGKANLYKLTGRHKNTQNNGDTETPTSAPQSPLLVTH